MTTFAYAVHPREITAAWLQGQIGGRIDDLSMAVIGQDRGFVGTVVRLTLSGGGAAAAGRFRGGAG